jgi:hypothetical protein
MNLTGPLGKQYCMVFKFMALFTLFLTILAIVTILYNLFTSKNNAVSWMLLANIPVYIFVYIQNRLLYNICLQ